LQRQSTDLWISRWQGTQALVPIDSDHNIQANTPGAIPRGVLCQRNGDVRDTDREVNSICRMAEVFSVCKQTPLTHTRVMRLPRPPQRVIAQLPYVKLRLSELDINRRLDRRDDLRFSKGDTKHPEKRADHGAVTLWLHSLGK
jgi:hypothetical protein